jgi:ABC-type sugar transport system ATPase subunit
MRHIEKHYGGIHALRGADLVISKPGVVHTLVGENGSGKSTLLGILAGNVRGDGGRIEIDGEPCNFRSPVEAIRKGIAMVSQEIAVVPDLTIAENVLLGRRMVRTAVGIDRRGSRKKAKNVLEGLGLDYDPDTLVRTLRPDQRQMVEIARAVSMDARLLILDEPTSSLTDDEVEGLFSTIRGLKTKGVAILFVSHRLDDLFTIADEITVLRDGRTACQAPMSEMDAERLVTEMVGEPIERVEEYRREEEASGQPGAVRLSARELSAVATLDGISFDLRAGEILGVAGLAGSGRSELLEALFGVLPCNGDIELNGSIVKSTGARATIRRGIGFLPPDRKTQGLNLEMSVRDNLTAVANLRRPRLGRPSRRSENELAGRLARRMGVRSESLAVPVGTLSGGNQQKVALGRWVAVADQVLLLDEPTRGVDVAAKWEIGKRLRELADEGLSLLVSSADNEELLTLCDRILVLFRGRLVATLTADQASDATLARLSGGHV